MACNGAPGTALRGNTGPMTTFSGRPGGLALLASLVATIAGLASPAAARSTVPVGNDVSWPQCGKTLPTGQAFGIVGVNGGLPTNTNPCFATQLAWAQGSADGTSQPKAALYVNTANPGLQSTTWPTNNVDPSGATVSNPYGSCTGADDAACAYMYGWDKAELDFTSRGVPSPSTFFWWLDVETTNSWETSTQANTADLEGMTTYFERQGGRVGVYSTRSQWGVITGTAVGASSVLAGLPNWIPGARTLKAAKANCATAPFTPGSTVTVTQYISRSLDYDYSCQ